MKEKDPEIPLESEEGLGDSVLPLVPTIKVRHDPEVCGLFELNDNPTCPGCQGEWMKLNQEPKQRAKILPANQRKDLTPREKSMFEGLTSE